jgi:hypothetical protein
MPRPSPYSCPICGRLILEPLFDDIQITANTSHEQRNVGGLEGFMCTENRHIFFVMKKDIEKKSDTGWAATGT